MTACTYMPSQNRQRGISLIEVLITVVILAVGLLGIAGLQLMSKRTNFESVQRTTGIMLANEVLEHMRANPKGLYTYTGLDTDPLVVELTGTSIAVEPTPTCVAATPCSTTTGDGPINLANHDRWEFEQIMQGVSETVSGSETGGLAQPTLCITSSVPAGAVNRSGHYRITVAWRGQTALSDPDTANPCGQASGNYDDDTAAAGNNKHRRLVVIDAYITES